MRPSREWEWTDYEGANAMKAKASQSDKFRQTARELGCDESEEAFDAKLRTIAKQKPKEAEPKAKALPAGQSAAQRRKP